MQSISRQLQLLILPACNSLLRYRSALACVRPTRLSPFSAQAAEFSTHNHCPERTCQHHLHVLPATTTGVCRHPVHQPQHWAPEPGPQVQLPTGFRQSTKHFPFLDLMLLTGEQDPILDRATCTGALTDILVGRRWIEAARLGQVDQFIPFKPSWLVCRSVRILKRHQEPHQEGGPNSWASLLLYL